MNEARESWLIKFTTTKTTPNAMALLTATASAIAISNSPCLLQSFNHSSFSHRIGFPKSPNFSSSCNFLSIQSQKKLENFSGGKNNNEKQSSRHQNASPSFAELKALNFHQSHKNPTSKTPPNHRQTTHKNEGKRQTRTNNHKNPNAENEEDSKLYNRASSEPSLSGGEILMALQRAYQEKANERSRKFKQKAASATKREKGFQEREKRRVIGEVRPITVKPQWSAQIESLEKRLQELKEKEDIT